jgi:SAM-dependent methyltransferase
MSGELTRVPPDELMMDVQYDPRAPSRFLAGRWGVYEHAEHYVDPLEMMYSLALKHGATREGILLDVGCNDATDLKRLCGFGHQGLMYGVDPALDPANPQLASYQAKGASGPGIAPIQNVMEEAYVPRGSVNILLSKFMLYHVNDVGATLSRFNQLLADDGVLVLSTSGAVNKCRQHDQFEPLIAEKLKINPPRRFNKKFTAEIAQEILPDHFRVVDRYTQATHASFTEKNIGIFIGSLLSMQPSFHPYCSPEEYMQAITTTVMPLIRQEIQENGSFSEVIDRRFYACRKRTLQP